MIRLALHLLALTSLAHTAFSWFHIHSGKGIFTLQDGDRVDERETSMMMHLHSDLVLAKSDRSPGKNNRWKLQAMLEK